MSVFDWFSEKIYGVDTQKQLADSLAPQVQAVEARYQPGGDRYTTDKNAAAARQDMTEESGAFLSNVFDAQYAETRPDKSKTSGLWNLFKSVGFLIGLAVVAYLFFTFGGVAQLKKLSQKGKYWSWAVIGGSILAVWFVWSKIKGVGKSAANVGTQFSNNVSEFF